MSLVKAAGIRALRTAIQTIIGAGITIGVISASTDWLGVGLTVVNIVAATALASLIAFLQGILKGLPEAE